ncbi:MAG: beta galactosidase jelly roll domain-containing protein [Muribaculaceae bacterium]|nr:beta galactosidase jelly roll domain-containing protein [Muribaculaceae bacterium]
MRNIIVIFCILLVEFCSLAQTSFGNAANFNEGWLFSLGDTTASAPGFNDSGWRKLCLPHDWSIEGIPSPSLPSCAGYLPAGIAWYRKHFSLSDSAAKHYIYFEGIYNRSEVYLNGHLLGKRPNGYISFMYDLSPWLKDGDNVLAVRVDHSRNADSRWYSGSGIYRDVWLVAANESHIALWGVGYEATLSGSNASIEVKVEIDNPLPGSWLEVALADNSGKTIAKSKCRAARLNNLQLKAKNIRRWSLDDTYLYNMTTTLTSSGKSSSCITPPYEILEANTFEAEFNV